MKKLLIISLLATLLFANNPRVYSAIGDDIYNNVTEIDNLKNVAEYQADTKRIDDYVKDVQATKDIGLKIESGDKTQSPSKYLQKLRILSKTNLEYKRSVNINFNKSINEENSLLFSQMLNSGLLDINANKKNIFNYYSSHKDDIEVSPNIQILLDEQAAILKLKQARNLTKKQIEESRIKRLRRLDKEKKEKIAKVLEEELIQEKKDIRKTQKIELAK